ncbi:MAG: tetratricopeptide repeat protein [Rubrivivax sp.]|nr:tetratricopeptide repeat protein [Rubrivivax sp.]
MPRTDEGRAARRLRRTLCLLATLTSALMAAPVQAQLLDDVEWRRQGDDAVLLIRLVVPVQLQRVAASRTNDQWSLFYRVLPNAEPAAAGGAERLLPARDGGVPGLRITDDLGVQLRSGADRRLVLRLQSGLPLKVRPGPDPRSIELVAEGRGRRLPLPPEAPGTGAAGERYHLVLLRGDAAELANAPAVPSQLQQHALSMNQRVVEGRLVSELSLGPFGSRREAEAALRQLQGRFPQAVIELETPAQAAVPEAAAAEAPGPAAAASPSATTAVAPAEPAAVVSADEAAREAAAQLASAREALRGGAPQTAITILSRLLELPPTPSSRAAQVMLGEARLQAGDAARARAEFEALLKQYPQGEDSNRVRTLLASLGDGPAPAAPPRPRVEVLDVVSGSVSLYHYGGQSKVRTQDFADSPLGGLPVLVNEATLSGVDQSLAVVSADLNWRYRDSEVDRRFVFRDSYTRDFERRHKSRNRLSALYVDERRPGTGLAWRAGRQSPLGGGVMGRFDGVQASYAWRPQWKLAAVAGVPADALLDARRHFVGASVEAEALLPGLGATLYGIEQRIDGYVDRRAVGNEWRYFDEGLTGTAQLDYDVALKTMNIVSLQGSWQRADNGVVNVLYDRRASPLLSLGNALFFALPADVFARRITDLVDAGTPLQQLQRQVRDTTAMSTQASLGGTLPLSAHWQVGADLRYSNIGAIPPVPDLLPQGQPSSGDIWSANLQFIATNLYSARDTHVFAANHLSGPGFTGQLLSYQNASALNAAWQLDPSLKWYRQRSADGTTSTRWTPGLRATWRFSAQDTLEGEVSVENSRLQGPLRNENSRRTFFYVGGRHDF